FPLIYQYIYKQIIKPGDIKKPLNKKYLKLLNDVYRTRLSNKSFEIILNGLQAIEDFKEYKAVIKKFEKCNPTKKGKKNAFSFGTKVLHTFNPEKNPIFDSVIKDNINLSYDIDVELCIDFRNAMNDFANDHEKYFLLNNSKRICEEFKKNNLSLNLPKMKILDMALYLK
ncbi:MAG: hypothetical protein ACFFD2_26145, partial [Promethearchaeota archaeon]